LVNWGISRLRYQVKKRAGSVYNRQPLKQM
jgi:hypothetical protein